MSAFRTIGTTLGLLASPAFVYVASWFAEVRGVHDFIYPGAVWRTRKPHVVLSFDDGPDPERTPRLLDALAASEARALFFVVGTQVERRPDLVQRMAREGHIVGNHSYSHRWLPVQSTRRIEDEIDRCQDAVRAATGSAPVLARPPYGHKDFRYYRVLAERGMTAVLWSRNLRDYYRTSSAVLVRRLARARPGEIVMAHDGDPLAPHTVTAVTEWLKTRPAVGLL